ncbi:MAG: hypothetical protein KF760_18945 [Candidatus Eremiobacteraeota bacterium]|nr:hypothetical protein [Candidatus Eremiobacteraeota bacterium]MCW5868477.1 hypothetical protein [Candidatus Eremiobacteraeota bacterium]
MPTDIPPPPPAAPAEPVEENPWQANLDIRVQPLNPSKGGDPTKGRFKDLASRYEARKIPQTQANIGHGLRAGIPAGLLTGAMMCAFRKSQVDDMTRLAYRKNPKIDKHGSQMMGYTMCYDLFLGVLIGAALGLSNLLCFYFEASRAGAVLGALAGGVLSFIVGKGFMGVAIGAIEGLVLGWLASAIENKLFRGN